MQRGAKITFYFILNQYKVAKKKSYRYFVLCSSSGSITLHLSLLLHNIEITN